MALGAVLIAALGATACSDDDDDAQGASDVDVVAVVDMLDKAGLHAIDDAINVDREAPAGAGTTARKLQAAVALLEWPEGLSAGAEALGTTFGELAAALDADEPDLAVAGPAAEAAHDEAHDFSAAVWAYLYEAAGIDAGGEGGHD